MRYIGGGGGIYAYTILHENVVISNYCIIKKKTLANSEKKTQKGKIKNPKVQKSKMFNRLLFVLRIMTMNLFGFSNAAFIFFIFHIF